MHWGKVILHGLVLIFLFLLVAIMVNPLTDWIDNHSIRVTIKELMRIGLTLGILKLYVRKFFNKTDAYFRIQILSKTGKLWIVIGLLMPFTVIAFYMLAKLAIFEQQEQVPFLNGFLIIVSSFVAACSAGVLEEFLFRGFLFKLFEEKWNMMIAVFVTSFLFGTLHLLTMNNLNLIDGSLVLIGGTLVGIMFSLIVYKTGNVWNSVVVHIIWNFFMNSSVVQFAHIMERAQSSLVLLCFQTECIWITGGAYGIEVALPVMMVYILIISFTVFGKQGVKNHSIKM
jgi:uncharacterized protein